MTISMSEHDTCPFNQEIFGWWRVPLYDSNLRGITTIYQFLCAPKACLSILKIEAVGEPATTT
jgi:hypothetical protein